MAEGWPLSKSFTDFFESEKSGAVLLIVGTVVSLTLANSSFGPDYLDLWKRSVAGLDLQHWINDALLATDVAFALGVLALLGSRVAQGVPDRARGDERPGGPSCSSRSSTRRSSRSPTSSAR